MIDLLSTKTVMSVLVGTILSIAARYGLELDNKTIEDLILNLINIGTVAGVIFGRWKAKKTFS